MARCGMTRPIQLDALFPVVTWSLKTWLLAFLQVAILQTYMARSLNVAMLSPSVSRAFEVFLHPIPFFIIETYFDHAVKRVCRSTLAAATGRVFTCVGAGEYVRALVLEL